MTPFRTRNARRALGWWLFVAFVFGTAFAVDGYGAIVFFANVALIFFAFVAMVGCLLFFTYWVSKGEIE